MMFLKRIDCALKALPFLFLATVSSSAYGGTVQDMLVGRWFGGIERTFGDGGNSHIRICGTIEYFPTMKSQFRGQGIIKVSETQEEYGQISVLSIVYINDNDFKDNKIITTTTSGKSELVEFSMFNNGMKMEIKNLSVEEQQAYTENYDSTKTNWETFVEIGHVQQENILSIDNNRMVTELIGSDGWSELWSWTRTETIKLSCDKM